MVSGEDSDDDDCEICKYPDHERDEGRQAGREELDRHKTVAVTRGDLRVRIRILFRASSCFLPQISSNEQRARAHKHGRVPLTS